MYKYQMGFIFVEVARGKIASRDERNTFLNVTSYHLFAFIRRENVKVHFKTKPSMQNRRRRERHSTFISSIEQGKLNLLSFGFCNDDF